MSVGPSSHLQISFPVIPTTNSLYTLPNVPWEAKIPPFSEELSLWRNKAWKSQNTTGVSRLTQLIKRATYFR
jgi:hypothetical protein